MKRLLLLRHAKSARPAGIADRERPLAPRGIGDARMMGAYLRREMLLPDLALVSPAVRTRQTFDLAGEGLGAAVEARFDPTIYDALRSEELAELVHDAPAAAGVLLLIGHNPVIEELALSLAGHGDRYALARIHAKFPTCGLAVLDIAADEWRAFMPKAARLDHFVTPKTLDLGPDG